MMAVACDNVPRSQSEKGYLQKRKYSDQNFTADHSCLARTTEFCRSSAAELTCENEYFDSVSLSCLNCQPHHRCRSLASSRSFLCQRRALATPSSHVDSSRSTSIIGNRIMPPTSLPLFMFVSYAFLAAFTFALLLLCAGGSHAQDMLSKKILKRTFYDPLVPPGNFARNVRMQIHFDILQLVEVVESEQWIKTRLWTSLYWNDERLMWNPDEVDGVTYVFVPPAQIWTPYLFVDNSAELQYTKPWAAAEVNISYTGKIAMKGYMVLITNCPMRVRSYPFDKQECPIMISTSDNKFQLGGEPPTVNFTLYTFHHSEFQITDLKVITGLPTNLAGLNQVGSESSGTIIQQVNNEAAAEYDTSVITVTLMLYIKRNALQHIISLVLPCSLICVLGITGLFAAWDPSGQPMERFRFGMTAVVSLVIFQLGLWNFLPTSMDGVPVLSIYYNVLFAIICFATIATSVSITLHGYGLQGRRFPWYLKWMIKMSATYPKRLKKPPPNWDAETAKECWCVMERRNGDVVAEIRRKRVIAEYNALRMSDALDRPAMLQHAVTRPIISPYDNADARRQYKKRRRDSETARHSCGSSRSVVVHENEQAEMNEDEEAAANEVTEFGIADGEDDSAPRITREWIELARLSDIWLMIFFFALLTLTNVCAFSVWLST